MWFLYFQCLIELNITFIVPGKFWKTPTLYCLSQRLSHQPLQESSKWPISGWTATMNSRYKQVNILDCCIPASNSLRNDFAFSSIVFSVLLISTTSNELETHIAPYHLNFDLYGSVDIYSVTVKADAHFLQFSYCFESLFPVH